MPDTRDMTKRSAVKGLAGWLRKGSGAIAVVVIRGEDHVFDVDPLCAPADAAELVATLLPDLVRETTAEREQARLERAEKQAKRAARKAERHA